MSGANISPASGASVCALTSPLGSRTVPLSLLIDRASRHVSPSALTLSVKSSLPVRPSSARPADAVWNSSAPVLAAAALSIFTRMSPLPGVWSSWAKSAASDLTARRFTVSAPVLMPNFAACSGSGAMSLQPPPV